MNARADAVPAALDPRVKRTRTLLREALVALLAEQSFEAITVHDIAERATVNRVTFYDHFVDKFALLEDLIRESCREKLVARIADSAGFPLRALVLGVCDYVRFLDSRCCKGGDRPIFQPLVESTVKELLREILLGELRRLPPARLRVPPELGATVAGWALYGAVLEWGRSGFRSTEEAFAEQILPSLTAALFTP